ncbi:hypothetical protein [Nioella aestuarii]|uniref:hypothetical protein n=1 Tax=Nioella aestuarii TaxID=1662864 RepID=UPI003D7FCBEC
MNAVRIKSTLVNIALSGLVAVLSLTAPVIAQTDSLPIQAIRDRVALLYETHDRQYDLDVSEATLRVVFDRQGVTEEGYDYLTSSSGGLFQSWSHLRPLYRTADRTLSGWVRAVRSGRYTTAEAEAVLRPALDRFETLHDQIGDWLEAEAEARAVSAHLNGQHQWEAARAVLPALDRPDYAQIGRLEIFPREDGPLDPRPEAEALARAVANASPEDHRRLAASATALIRLTDPTAADALEELIDLLEARTDLLRQPVSAILDEAEALPDDSRARADLLARAQDRLTYHLSHETRLAAGAATAAGEEEREEVIAALLAQARRLIRMRNDLIDPTRPNSPALRFVSVLHASLLTLGVSEDSTPEVRELRVIISEVGSAVALAGQRPPTAIFAGAFGAASGLAGQSTAGILQAADCLELLNAAIANNDQSVTGSADCSRELERMLQGRAFVAEAAQGFLESTVAQLPVIGSLVSTMIGWFSTE